MRVGLYGFGRTGRAVASLLLLSNEANLEWVVRKSTTLQHRSVPEFLGIKSSEKGTIISKDEISPGDLLDKNPVDVIIDFSSAEAILEYGTEAAKRNIAIVSAISSYPMTARKHLHMLSKKTRILWSPNITVGINFLILAAKIMKTISPGIDVEIIEEHFKNKDGVSGTAVKISEALSLDKASIKSVRAGGIVGRHEILFGFPYQTVRLIHESIAREAFASGALFAAQRLLERGPGYYTMEDLLIPFFRI